MFEIMSFREHLIKIFRERANEGMEQAFRAAKEEIKRYIFL